MDKDRWEHIKHYKGTGVQYIEPSRKGGKTIDSIAIHGPKIVGVPRLKNARKQKFSNKTNHDRVVAGRAARLGITVQEYIALTGTIV